MPTFAIQPDHLADALWGRMADLHAQELDSVRSILSELFAHTELLRDEMEYPTGTVWFNSAIALYLLSRWAKPKVVFEVGTFVGNSCLSMAKAMEVNGQGGEIHTCDGSNSFKVPTELTTIQIKGYPKKLSTDALQAVKEQGKKVDLFHIDGRLLEDDYALIQELSHDETIIAIDDFEGIEKGVMNLMGFMSRAPWAAAHAHIAPPSGKTLAKIDPNADRCLTALLVPRNTFAFHATRFEKPVF